MMLMPLNRVAWHALGRRMAALGVIVNKAYSKGSVELVSPEPSMPPRVRFNLLDDSRDFERLIQGVRIALRVLTEHEVVNVRNEVFVPDTQIGSRLAQRSPWNWLQARLICAGLEIGPLRRAVLKSSVFDPRSLADDDRGIRDYVRHYAQAVYHVCGTCKMGRQEDLEAVVDTSCRVFGIAGLRVIDASVFPTVPAAATHLPVLMVAEKMADRVKSEWLDQRRIRKETCASSCSWTKCEATPHAR